MVDARSHILAVDDDAAMLSLYRDLLEDEGYRVTTRSRLPEGPAELVVLGPSLLVVDVTLGGEESGIRFLRELRAAPETAALPVVVATGVARLRQRFGEELEAWRCGVMVKPFDIDAFVGDVRARLGGEAGKAAMG